MPFKTPRAPKESGGYVAYTTKHFRKDLLRQCRIMATLLSTTIEHIVNLTVERGISVLEEEIRQGREITAKTTNRR